MNINLHFSLDQCSMLSLPKPQYDKNWGGRGKLYANFHLLRWLTPGPPDIWRFVNLCIDVWVDLTLKKTNFPGPWTTVCGQWIFLNLSFDKDMISKLSFSLSMSLALRTNINPLTSSFQTNRKTERLWHWL